MADIGPWRLPKSGHVTITKTGNLHIDTLRKNHWFQKCYSFRSTTKNNGSYHWKSVSEQCRHQALGRCDRRSSSVGLHPSSSIYVHPRNCNRNCNWISVVDVHITNDKLRSGTDWSLLSLQKVWVALAWALIVWSQFPNDSAVAFIYLLLLYIH